MLTAIRVSYAGRVCERKVSPMIRATACHRGACDPWGATGRATPVM